MHNTVQEVCNALDDLAQKVLKSWTEDRTLAEVYGWHHPPLTRQDLANMSIVLSIQIRDSNIIELDEHLDAELSLVPGKLQQIYATTIPYIFNGNGTNAYPVYLATLDWLRILIQPLIGWQSVTDVRLMPNKLAARLRGIQSSIDAIAPDFEKLAGQIKAIEDATSAAESLPTDLELLQQARNTIEVLSTQSSELKIKIDLNSQAAYSDSEFIKTKKEEADKLVEQCEVAYRITTTKGLAASFDQRATRLSHSIYAWVAGLLLSLVASVVIGATRYEVLVAKLNATNPSWGIITIHIILSILGLAAPIWFAWLATKQISQRFKLAEDYAYKASVAKAYEGYRREAARIDPAFEARLFGSALTRLEEAPLRLVESETHGSPWQELINSDGFQKALKQFPDLRNKFASLPKEFLSSVASGVKNVTHDTAASFKADSESIVD